ncbi:MAG TPA: hypothetical protein VK053_09255 [Jiangellaceae bacterium]|nr:hypothetical protein [Jiangellaceae bacterium]
MVDVIAMVCIGLNLALALWALVEVVRGKPLGPYHVIGVGVVEIAMLVQLVTAVVLVIAGHRPDDLAIFLTYLVITVLIPPIGLVWALAEKSRWGNAVLLVAALTGPVLIIRLGQMWQVVGG